MSPKSSTSSTTTKRNLRRSYTRQQINSSSPLIHDLSVHNNDNDKNNNDDDVDDTEILATLQALTAKRAHNRSIRAAAVVDRLQMKINHQTQLATENVNNARKQVNQLYQQSTSLTNRIIREWTDRLNVSRENHKRLMTNTHQIMIRIRASHQNSQNARNRAWNNMMKNIVGSQNAHEMQTRMEADLSARSLETIRQYSSIVNGIITRTNQVIDNMEQSASMITNEHTYGMRRNEP